MSGWHLGMSDLISVGVVIAYFNSVSCWKQYNFFIVQTSFSYLLCRILDQGTTALDFHVRGYYRA